VNDRRQDVHHTKILRRYQDVVDELKQDAASGMDALLGDERRG
jgi:hypothetical protein